MKPTTGDVLKWAWEAKLVSTATHELLEWTAALPNADYPERLKKFAALAYAAGAAAERERCIADCDSVDVIGADECIAAIRARE